MTRRRYEREVRWDPVPRGRNRRTGSAGRRERRGWRRALHHPRAGRAFRGVIGFVGRRAPPGAIAFLGP